MTLATTRASFGTGDRYRTLRLLGQGAMGEVWLAEDRRLQRQVAVKVILDSEGSLPAARERFLREARLLASLDHPGLVRVYDLGAEAGHLYIVEEYVDGEDLQARVDRGALLSPDEARALARTIAGALAYLHARDVIHRDLKPSNVLLDAEGRPRLADFGLALPPDETRLTASSAIVGTPFHFPPEVVGGGDYLPASDVFQFGFLLHQALTGRTILRSGMTKEDLWRGYVGRRLVPADLDRALPPDLHALVFACCAFDPRERLSDGAALARFLDAPAAQANAGERAAPPPRPPWPGRRALAAAVLPAVATMGLLAWWHGARSHGPRDPARPALTPVRDVRARPGVAEFTLAWSGTAPLTVTARPDGRAATVRVTDARGGAWSLAIDAATRDVPVAWNAGDGSSAVATGTATVGFGLRARLPGLLAANPKDRPEGPAIVLDDRVVLGLRFGPILGLRATPSSSGTVLQPEWALRPPDRINWRPAAVTGAGGPAPRLLLFSQGFDPHLLSVEPGECRAAFLSGGKDWSRAPLLGRDVRATPVHAWPDLALIEGAGVRRGEARALFFAGLEDAAGAAARVDAVEVGPAGSARVTRLADRARLLGADEAGGVAWCAFWCDGAIHATALPDGALPSTRALGPPPEPCPAWNEGSVTAGAGGTACLVALGSSLWAIARTPGGELRAWPARLPERPGTFVAQAAALDQRAFLVLVAEPAKSLLDGTARCRPYRLVLAPTGGPPTLEPVAEEVVTCSPGKALRQSPTGALLAGGFVVVNLRYDLLLFDARPPHGLRCSRSRLSAFIERPFVAGGALFTLTDGDEVLGADLPQYPNGDGSSWTADGSRVSSSRELPTRAEAAR